MTLRHGFVDNHAVTELGKSVCGWDRKPLCTEHCWLVGSPFARFTVERVAGLFCFVKFSPLTHSSLPTLRTENR